MEKISQFEIFGISSDYEVTKQEVVRGELVLHCCPANPQESYPKCGSQEIIKKREAGEALNDCSCWK